MIDLVPLNTPQGAWLKSLASGWYRVHPLATEPLRAEHDAIETEVRDEERGIAVAVEQ